MQEFGYARNNESEISAVSIDKDSSVARVTVLRLPSYHDSAGDVLSIVNNLLARNCP